MPKRQTDMWLNSKKTIITTLFFGVLCTQFITSCSTNSDSVDVSNIKVNVNILRIDEELMNLKDKAEIQSFVNKNAHFFAEFYQTNPTDSALINQLDVITHHPDSRALYEQAKETFGDLSELKNQFEFAFKHIKYYYPDFKEPKIITTFSGLEKDIYVSDSMIVVSLESFIGIVPTIIKFMSQKYNKVNPDDKTLLADMVFFGKSFEFTREMLPNIADSLIVDYPDSTLQKTWVAQDLVWAHFIDKKLLYESDLRIKAKYIDERPKTTEVGPECPGRIAQWVGWRIVSRYRTENSDISLQDLMKNPDAQDIFQKSKYKGQIED
ncbi:MAG: gliding motility protein [Spirosomaceae bacterium]|nr:gliding motility protein [Spirosomataceae bacterium]